MRPRALFLSTVMLTSVLGGAVYAQQTQPNAQTQPSESKDHTPQNGSAEGTKPENMGSTGWTGGTGGSHIGTSNSATSGSSGADSGINTEAAKGQPLTATGEDLKGPAVRFAPNKTPE